jgi:hypothetical protein
MSDWKLPWEGGCRCGELRFRVTQPPLLGNACHCAGCQKMSASAYALTLSLHEDGFEVTKGEPVLGGLRKEPRHHHCPACKSWVFTRTSEVPWLVNLRPTMLDDHAWFAPFADFHTGEGLAWARTGAPHSFETVPSLETYGELMAAYAKEGARPA